MNKRKLMSELKDLLTELSSASYEQLFDKERHEKPILDFVENLIDQLQKAYNELPRADLKAWTVEREFEMELMVTVKADIAKEVPQTHWEPGEPAGIEDMEIQIEGCGITSQLYDKLTAKYEKELEEQVWEEAEVQAEEIARSMAEDLMDAAEARRDLLEGR